MATNPTPTPDKPIEIQLGDGTVVKAPTMDEAFKVVAKMKEDTAAALKAERDRAAQLEQQNRELQARVPKPAVNGNSSFDKQHYFDLLSNDPMAAQDYLDAFRFDLGDPANVRPTFTSLNQTVSELRQQTTAAQFLQQHPEFPGGESAAVFRQRVEQLSSEGHPFNLRTLNLAWNELVTEGAIKPLEVQPETPETPPPTLRGAGGKTETTEAAELAKFQSMSTEDMEKYLRSKGAI